MAAQRMKAGPEKPCDPPDPGRDQIRVRARGREIRGVYSVADGWVEVIGESGLTKTARCGESSAVTVAERLLRELYARAGTDD